MTYPTIDENEKEKIAILFSLEGGELSDHPLRYATIENKEAWCIVNAEKNSGHFAKRVVISRRWARYFYDGVPEYAESDFRRMGGSYVTLCWDRGSYGDHTPPQSIHTGGKRYRRVKVYNSGGERECPYRTIHECMGHEDHPTVKEGFCTYSIVTRKEAKLGPSWRSISGFTQRPGWWKGRRAECPLCEARIGEAHGFVYMGEGWCEVVYRARD